MRRVDERRAGTAAGLAAYGLWGLFPLYFPLLEPAGGLEIVAHRVVWSLLFIALLLTALLVSTNVVGAGVVVVISTVVVPSQTATHGTVLSLAIAVPTYVAVAVVLTAAGLAGLRRRDIG